MEKNSEAESKLFEPDPGNAGVGKQIWFQSLQFISVSSPMESRFNGK
jgi:hypothetical protein